ncbi:MAG: hypothetical protein M3P32_08255 [Chloroflexota bacterium]|nr:hypothetical protein [Chloroflexota bacterium]
MRIYEGSPRQDWEEVLRSIGSFADRERLKELLLLELDAGFLLQGLALPRDSAWTESEGMLIKATHELPDDEIGKLIDEAEAKRSEAAPTVPHAEIANYYEQSLRVIGAYLDGQKARDVFFFEQDGAFVLRLLLTASGGAAAGHQLVEFTKEDILAMIEAAPTQRQ